MHEDVRGEREAILDAIRDERIAVLKAIADERRIVLDALREERVATFSDLDELMDRAFTREINKLFIRGLILIAILLGGFAAIIFLGVRALNKRNE
jgi:DNA-binding transcriptional ArsR family regulator